MARGDRQLSKVGINKAFEGPWKNDDGEIDPKAKPHQLQPFFKIWKMVFPDWDRIDHIDRWPTISMKTARYIMERFILFDRAHHPEVIAGGLWMNNGFSSRDDVEDWFVDTSTCTVHYKEADDEALQDD